MMLHLRKDIYFKFSAGEVHLDLAEIDIFHETSIRVHDYSMDGLMALAQMADILRKNGCKYLTLLLPYLPYSRQDRYIKTTESFSLKLYASMLNTIGFSRITTWDCHSDVGPALVDNIENIPQWDIAYEVIPTKILDSDETIFVSPDAGAYKKLSKLVSDDKRIAIGVKERGAKGEIISTNVYSPVDLVGKDCIIVDDICDGGKTFIELAKALKAKGAGKLYLYVTHGIFSKGFDELSKYFEHIYTTDSFNHISSKFLTVKEV